MENAPPPARNELRADLSLAQKTVRAGVVPSRDAKAERTWGIWLAFCQSINVDPYLSAMADPVPLLQTFGVRWRDGRIAPSGNPNRARSVEDAIRLVSQKFPLMGTKDPRLNFAGQQDFRLRRMYSAWKKEDDPPSRVEPVPMAILLRATELLGHNARGKATVDCMWMGFYYLLRPGEYANATGDAKHPFCLQDVGMQIGAQHFHHAHLATLAQLSQATLTSLTFTTQKNGVKGEKLSHTTTGHHTSCPVRSTLRRVAHLVRHNAPPNTPLHIYFDETGTRRAVSSAMITSILRVAALTIPGHAGVDPTKIAARSLRASGAMTLLLGGLDPDKIRIVGRWKSDAMFRYLHAHAEPLVRGNASLMFAGGHYNLIG